jgi:hypothetical protein
MASAERCLVLPQALFAYGSSLQIVTKSPARKNSMVPGNFGTTTAPKKHLCTDGSPRQRIAGENHLVHRYCRQPTAEYRVQSVSVIA